MTLPNAKRGPIPKTETEWSLAARNWGVEDLTQEEGVKAISRFANVSGSRMTFVPFLILRTIWKTNTIDKFKPSDWSLGENIASAEKDLSNYHAWSRYTGHIDTQAGAQAGLPAANIGVFSLVYYYQTQVRHLKNATKFDDTPSKVLHHWPVAASESSSSEEGTVVPVAPDSPLASKGKRSSETAVKRKGTFLERLAPSGRTETANITSSFDHLTLRNDSPHSKGKRKQAETLDQFEFQEPSPLEIVSPLKAASSPAVNDEQIVNTALVLFLNATTMFQNGVQADWTLHRRAFHIDKILETRTDGFLRHLHGDSPMAILEVKSHVRDPEQAAIQQQESAQIASWISELPDTGDIWNEKRQRWTRLLISQDHEEIYLTFAEYPPAYKAYITGRPDAFNENGSGPFLVMNQFGPWRTSIKGHMQNLGPIILAFTIRQSLYSGV